MCLKQILNNKVIQVVTTICIALSLVAGFNNRSFAKDKGLSLLITPDTSQNTESYAPAFDRPVEQPTLGNSVTPDIPVERLSSGIIVEGLADVNLEAVGILSRNAEKPWERDLGAGLWYRASQLNAIHAVQRLPMTSLSPCARALSRQILLTAAAPDHVLPDHVALDLAPVSKSNTEPAKLNDTEMVETGALLAARLNRLVVMGQVEDAINLSAILPQKALTEQVSLAQTRAQWLKGDTVSACNAVNDGAVEHNDQIWLKMQAACAYISDDKDKSQLTLALLDELGAIDEGFQPIADRILGKSNSSLTHIPKKMDVAEVAAFVAMGGKLPKTLSLEEETWLARLAIPREGTIRNEHLFALEFGLRRGVLSIDDADSVYARVKLTKKEKEAVKTLTADASTPRQRMAYYQALKDAGKNNLVPSAQNQVYATQVEIIAKLLKTARFSPQHRGVLAALLKEPLAKMLKSPLAVLVAGDAARFALWSGDWALFKQWVRIIKQNSFTSAKALRDLHTLDPLLAFVDAPQTADMRAAISLPFMAESWSTAQLKRGLSEKKLEQVRGRLFGLFRQFSINVASQGSPVSATSSGNPDNKFMASTDALISTQNAAVLGARGLALSGVAHLMGGVPEGDLIAPSDAEALVSVLLQVGYVDWAKRVAIESLLAAGA